MTPLFLKQKRNPLSFLFKCFYSQLNISSNRREQIQLIIVPFAHDTNGILVMFVREIFHQSMRLFATFRNTLNFLR
jgi:hypothetical protein